VLVGVVPAGALKRLLDWDREENAFSDWRGEGTAGWALFGTLKTGMRGAAGRVEDEASKASGEKALVVTGRALNPPNLDRGGSCGAGRESSANVGICTRGRGGIGITGSGARTSSHDILVSHSRLALSDVKLCEGVMPVFSNSKSRIARSASGSAEYKSCTILVRSGFVEDAEENWRSILMASAYLPVWIKRTHNKFWRIEIPALGRVDGGVAYD
jgi:hypothetical protein